MQVQDAKERDAYSKNETAERLGLGYVTVHKLIKTGQLRSVRVGKRVLIPRSEIERLLSGEQ